MKRCLPVLLASAFVFSIVTLGLADESETAARLRVKQHVPDLLVPAGSIVRIDLRLTDGRRQKRRTITDKMTIVAICSGLREAVLQDRFNIGQQFHEPSHTLEITLVHREEPPIRLTWVGASMYWMSWNSEMIQQQAPINFQSEEFDRVFFKNAYLELFWGKH